MESRVPRAGVPTFIVKGGFSGEGYSPSSWGATASAKRAPFCVRVCGVIDRLCSSLWCPPFDSEYGKRQRLQQRLVALYGFLSLLAALYPFYVLSFLQRSYPEVRPLFVTTGASAKDGGAKETAPSVWSVAAVVPEKTEHLYSFDHGLLYALLHWSVSLMLPLQAALLLATHAAAKVQRKRGSDSSRCSVCAVLTGFNGRILLLNGCWCVVLAVLSALNLTSYFKATTKEANIKLNFLAWVAPVLSVGIQLPLGVHARNVVRFLEGATALQRMRDVVEEEERFLLSATDSTTKVSLPALAATDTSKAKLASSRDPRILEEDRSA